MKFRYAVKRDPQATIAWIVVDKTTGNIVRSAYARDRAREIAKEMNVAVNMNESVAVA